MKRPRIESETIRALGKLAAAGFSVSPAETASRDAGELPIVTVYSVVDPYGATVRLTPSQIRKWAKVAF